MRFLWLPILIVSFISLVSSVRKDLNPCDAIDKTDTNLSDVVALFVNFKWKDEEKSFDNLTLALINAITRHEESKKEDNKLSSLHEIMENFFKCYGGSGGLQVKHVTFEKEMNGTADCQMKIDENTPKQSDFSKKQVKIIQSPDHWKHCGQSYQLDASIWRLVRESFYPTQKRIVLCHWPECERLNNSGFYLIPVSANTRFYEVMEDEINNLDSGFFKRRESEEFELKYSYFTTFPRTPAVWSSFMAVLTVISFFVLGLILCCCSLMTFGLVEEDFQKRNEERDWIAQNVRRSLERDYVFSPGPRVDNDLATAISRSSASGMETARSSFSTDSTQPSETEQLLPIIPILPAKYRQNQN